MNTNTEDRRVRKTKKALREGLAELMMEKDLRNITVRELVDKVDIHRATFYVHYKDIYDLYEQIEDSVIDEIISLLSDSSLSDKAFYETLMNYIYNNAKLCRMLLDKNGARSFLNRIGSILEEKYIAIWLDGTGAKMSAEEHTFFAAYHMRGCLEVISRWVEDNFAYPKEKLVDVITRLDTTFDELMS